jgi:adenylate cyclase
MSGGSPVPQQTPLRIWSGSPGGRPAGRVVRALVLGGLTALAGGLLVLLPATSALEESWGLDLLFHLRGARPPAPEVAIVGIDRQSADRLGLASDPARWPRSLHARLVDALARRGASVIVFDMVFNEPRAPEEDTAFADAIRRAQNVVLAAYVTREWVPWPGTAGRPASQLILERLVPPIPVLADAAVGLAPFPLPKVPVRLSQYWTFKTGAGDLPTLPVVALHVFGLPAHETFVRLFEQASPYHVEKLPRDREAVVSAGHAEQMVRQLREILEHEGPTVPAMRARLGPVTAGMVGTGHRRTLAALLDVYGGGSSRYLNFYGPPQTLWTIPYHEALDAPGGRGPPDLSGKAVFVGVSDVLQPQQRDGFFTVFSLPNGADLSGVEIAATAFANLLDGTRLDALPLPLELTLVVAWGLLVGTLARVLVLPVAVPATVALGLLYVGVAYQQFVDAVRWLPLVTPLVVQVPLAILAAAAWSHVETLRERRAVRRALGYYLPATVVDDVVGSLGDLKAGSRLVHGTCLLTDAHQYTTLAETMDPAELGAFMNRYYDAVFEPVRRHGGVVQDVVGDSMLAIWATAKLDDSLRAQACAAALDVAHAVDRFNAQSAPFALRTRIGLHSGRVLIGNIGAADHYEYRAVGDIVNATMRLEGLNKELETRILVTREVIDRIEGFITRDLGVFLLPGKSRPLEVHELVCRADEATPAHREICARFHEALAAYREQAWKEAYELFRECDAHGRDGPARFYARRCRTYVEMPPSEPWDPVVRVAGK